MSIRHLEEAKELREQGDRLGRAGMSKRVITLISEFDGTYKGAMELAGALMEQMGNVEEAFGVLCAMTVQTSMVLETAA